MIDLMVKIIMIAPSGGGKGTLARFLRNDLGIPHINTGEILRNWTDTESDLGKQVMEARGAINQGKFLSDELMGRVVAKRLEAHDCVNGFILDGFPRSIGQAHHLDDLGVKPDLVIELVATDEIVIERMRGRWVCRRCRANHNEKLGPVNECRNCGGELYQREDDKEEMIRRRLSQYREQEIPLREFYEAKGVLLKITSGIDNPPGEIFLAVKEYLWKQSGCDEEHYDTDL